MTDRLHSLTVVLEKDIREDDAQVLIVAIRQLRGILSVSGNVSDVVSHVAAERARYELRERLYQALSPED